MHTRAELYWRYLKRRLNAANIKTDEQVFHSVVSEIIPIVQFIFYNFICI